MSEKNTHFVCSGCFQDATLKEIINTKAERPGCDFCGCSDFPTIATSQIFNYIRSRVETFFTCSDYSGNFFVGDRDIHESTTWGRYPSDYLLEKIMLLGLPRDRNRLLLTAICDEALENKKWASLEYGRMPHDAYLKTLWWMFEVTVKHCRRFSLDKKIAGDGYTANEIFDEILPSLMKLKSPIQPGYRVYRARKSLTGEEFLSADELGPPPPKIATQSNRMNPPGIPYFYGADMEDAAVLETCIESCDAYSIGIFETKREIQIVDLSDLPPIKGWFTDVSLEERQRIKFLHEFSKQISEPIIGDDRTHLDYIPTQVFTELVRDRLGVHGIRYRSSKLPDASNIVLFISSNEVEGATKRGVLDQDILKSVYAPLEIIRLLDVKHIAGSIIDIEEEKPIGWCQMAARDIISDPVIRSYMSAQHDELEDNFDADIISRISEILKKYNN
ncbi:MAG: RES domain-containing protein [Gluconobacter japonicus]|uniref:RES domain-containing protein n=1 Tax=Gluconobacter japonicus TaxID=376620 RepID=UPI0039E77F6F